MTADALLAETIERLLLDTCPAAEVERAEHDGWSQPTWEALADAGFTLVGIDETRGGSGGDLDDVAAVLAAIGRFGAPVPLAETAVLGGWVLATAGLGLPAGPVTSIAPTTVVDGRVRLDAVAAWGRHAERIAVLAAGPAGTVACSIRPEQVSITPGRNLAGEARDRVVADIALTDTEVAAFPSDPSELVQRGVWSRAALAAGALTAVAELTVGYTNERRQFGQPVARFQAVQQHLVTVAQSAVRAQMAADIAGRALARGDAATEIAAARVVVDDAITLGTWAAHQAHGAMGVTREYPLHQLTRRLWSWRHEWGTTRDWRRRLGRGALDAGADGLFAHIVGST